MEPELRKQEDNENSINSVGGVQPGTAIVMRSKDTEIESGEDGNSSPTTEVPETSELSGEERKVKALEPEKKDCVVDVNRGGGSVSGESFGAEKVCRICHVSSKNLSENSELIQLGCGCKDDLGISHRHCAEKWFKHRGNRQCEICGKTAINITGIQDSRIFMVEWNEMRLMSSSAAANTTSSRECSCPCRHCFCNFLLACLVLAFVVPWFFRVDMI